MWAIAFAVLAIASALPGPPEAALSVDDRTPFVGEPVRFDASASRGHDQGQGRIAAYRFDFGDGAGTEWQASPFADHAYAAAGAYEANVTIRDGRGLQGRASIRVEARSTPPPTGVEPDLVVRDATPIPAKPRVNDLMSLAIVIRNQGSTSADDATIEVTDLRPSGASVIVATLRLAAPLEPDGLRILVTPSFVAIEAGRHGFRIAIRDVVPSEVFLGNNEKVVSVDIAAAGGGEGGGPLGLNPLPIVLAFAALGAAAAAVAVARRRREPTGPEPGPPEPPGHEPPPPWPP